MTGLEFSTWLHKLQKDEITIDELAKALGRKKSTLYTYRTQEVLPKRFVVDFLEFLGGYGYLGALTATRFHLDIDDIIYRILSETTPEEVLLSLIDTTKELSNKTRQKAAGLLQKKKRST